MKRKVKVIIDIETMLEELPAAIVASDMASRIERDGMLIDAAACVYLDVTDLEMGQEFELLLMLLLRLLEGEMKSSRNCCCCYYSC